MEVENNKSELQNLFQKITLLEKAECFVEDIEYKNFISQSLKKIIDECSFAKDENEIAKVYYDFLNESSYVMIKYLLIFLKKYHLMDFYTYDYSDKVYSSHKDGLTQQDILDAYNKELILINFEYKNKEVNKGTTSNVFEQLDNFESMEQKSLHLSEITNGYEESLRLTDEENAYYNFILDSTNGLYNILKNALYNYNGQNFIIEYNDSSNNFYLIKELLDKYGIDIKMLERKGTIGKDYLPSITNLEDIKNIFICFYNELQQIEYYSKSKEELWQNHQKFISSNEEWLTAKRKRD